MKKIVILLFVAVLFSFAKQENSNAMGLFYTDTTYPVTATGASSNKPLNYLKKGTSSALNILGVVEMGDAGIKEATKDANIKKVNFIDVNEKTVLFFFRKITTNVYGE